MTDIYDQATQAEELHRELALKQARNKKKSTFSGHCRYCNVGITEGSFCSSECRNDQELEDKIKRIAGRF